jgi:hypothetical protein
MQDTSSNWISETWTQVANVYKAKVRAVFGPWVILNEDTFTMTVWGYDPAGAGTTTQNFVNMYTNTKKETIQLMGSHEVYWWPHRNFLLSRLSDGMTFQFSRFANGFSASSTFDDIEDTQVALRLLQVQGRVTMRPIFHEDLAVFYTSERNSNQGTLWFYMYNTHTEQLELQWFDDQTSGYTWAETS